MFKKRYLKGGELGDNSGVKKWLFRVLVFVVIAAIWIIYFLSSQYIGKKDAIVLGTILYRGEPVIDVDISIGEDRVVTDENGNFVLPNIGYGNQSIAISKSDYLPLERSFFIWKKKYNLGKIEIWKDSDNLFSFSGRVIDSFTKKPIKDAVVTFDKSVATSDIGGEFIFDDMKKGNYALIISAIGYQDLVKDIDLGGLSESSQDLFLSPYGKMSFSSSRDGKTNIYSIGYDGNNLKNYTAGIKGDCWSGKFNADGNNLVFYSNLGDDLDIWGQKTSNLYFMNIEDGKAKKINRDNIIPENDYRLSQDKGRVLFLGEDKDDGKKELYVASIDNSQEWIQLTNNDIVESNFDISPDGNLAVFGAFEEGERRVFLVDIATMQFRPILSSQNREETLMFSPDSKKLLYTMEGYDLETKVFVYDIESEENKQIYRNIAGIKDIVWSASGSKIAFIASRDDRNYIYSMDSEGKNEVRLIEKSGNYNKLVWPSVEKIMIIKMHDGEGEVLAVMDITQRKIQKIEDISDDTIGWQKN